MNKYKSIWSMFLFLSTYSHYPNLLFIQVGQQKKDKLTPKDSSQTDSPKTMLTENTVNSALANTKV